MSGPGDAGPAERDDVSRLGRVGPPVRQVGGDPRMTAKTLEVPGEQLVRVGAGRDPFQMRDRAQDLVVTGAEPYEQLLVAGSPAGRRASGAGDWREIRSIGGGEPRATMDGRTGSGGRRWLSP